MSNVYRGTGFIQYDPYRGGMKTRTQNWCIVNIDREITRYYRWWLDKEILNPLGLDQGGLMLPAWDAHISVIRGEFVCTDPKCQKLTCVKPPGFEPLFGRKPECRAHLWNKYQGKKVEFYYEHPFWYDIGRDNKQPGYFFTVDVQSKQLMDIRLELGLKADWNFHITFGRTYQYAKDPNYGATWMQKEAMIT